LFAYVNRRLSFCLSFSKALTVSNKILEVRSSPGVSCIITAQPLSQPPNLSRPWRDRDLADWPSEVESHTDRHVLHQLEFSGEHILRMISSPSVHRWQWNVCLQIAWQGGLRVAKVHAHSHARTPIPTHLSTLTLTHLVTHRYPCTHLAPLTHIHKHARTRERICALAHSRTLAHTHTHMRIVTSEKRAHIPLRFLCVRV